MVSLALRPLIGVTLACARLRTRNRPVVSEESRSNAIDSGPASV
jgi:hypothetical protein